jgi:hypothetical protein
MRSACPAVWHESGFEPGKRGWRSRDSRGRPIKDVSGDAFLTVCAFRNRGDIRTITFPLMPHRPFPAGAVIKQVDVHRRKIANDYRWSATFLCRVPDRKSAPTGKAEVAINIGWRRIGDTLRVAAVMREGETRAEFLELPESLVSVYDRLDEIDSRRDKLHISMVTALRAY